MKIRNCQNTSKKVKKQTMVKDSMLVRFMMGHDWLGICTGFLVENE